MKILYIVNSRIPTEKAHGYQICKMCEEFVKTGNELELWAPKIKNQINVDLFKYYRLEKKFVVKKLFVVNLLFLEKILKTGLWFFIQSWTFYLRIFFCRLSQKDIIYTRNSELAWLLAVRKKRMVVEVHDLSVRRSEAQIRRLKKAYGIIAITNGLKNRLVEKGINPNRVMVAPDAVDLDKFAINISKDEARKKIGLPIDKKIVLYVGHLYEWKGVHTLAEASKTFNDDTMVVFVGGTDKDIISFRKKYEKVRTIMIAGRVEYGVVPIWLKAADVLVLPNSGKEAISRLYTSPLKMFEYMASQRPIVASDLPSIRDVLNENNCVFFEADNPGDLKEKIEYLLNKPDLMEVVARQARKDVNDFTWQKRAQNIINFLKIND